MKLITAVLFALVIGYQSPPESGYVIGHSYDDPDEWTTQEEDWGYACKWEYGLDPATGDYGYGRICKTRVIGHHTAHHYDGPHWYLEVRDDKDKDHVGDVEVTAEQQQQYPVGVHWPDPR